LKQSPEVPWHSSASADLYLGLGGPQDRWRDESKQSLWWNIHCIHWLHLCASCLLSLLEKL
jgi:hypothetical protein